MALQSCCCFNPHPAFWPDATAATASTVSILIRPATGYRASLFQSSSGLLAGCNRARPRQMNHGTAAMWARGFNPHPAFWPDATAVVVVLLDLDNAVSILIRPSGRMQPKPTPLGTSLWSVFQSSSGLLAGCNRSVCSPVYRLSDRFNPHPAFWPDATPLAAAVLSASSVSILIRPSGRMQLAVIGGQLIPHIVFQSSSGLLAGCNRLSASLA